MIRSGLALGRRGAAWAALVLALSVANLAPVLAAEARLPRSIEVTGEGRIEVPPDLALLDLGVVAQAESAAAAARENSERMERVLAALRQVVGTDGTLRTGTYSIRPIYAQIRDQGTPRVTGYEVSNIVHLRTKALGRLGAAIDAAVKAGANQVQRLVFALDDDTAARRNALRSAAQQAREKAHALAAALGLKPGAVHSLVEQELGVVRPLARQAAAIQAESAAFTPVEPGLIDVRARVVLTIEMEDPRQPP